MTDKELLSAISGMIQPMKNELRSDLSDLVSSMKGELQSDLSNMVSSMKSELQSDLSNMMNSTKNELLLTLSDMMDHKLKPINERVKNIEIMIEDNILPRLQTIETCYTQTYYRYQTGILQLDAIQMDVDVMKQVVQNHSEKLRNIS